MFVSTPFFSLMRQEWNMCSTARSVTDSLYQCDGLCVPMWRDFFCFLVASTIFYQCDGNFFTIVMKEKYHYDGIIFPVPKCLFTNVQGCQCTNVPRPPRSSVAKDRTSWDWCRVTLSIPILSISLPLNSNLHFFASPHLDFPQVEKILFLKFEFWIWMLKPFHFTKPKYLFNSNWEGGYIVVKGGHLQHRQW